MLVLNQYFPPDTSATAGVASEVVEALAESGHRVTVVAGRPSYEPTERHAWRFLSRDRSGEVTVERLGSCAFPRRHMVGRVANYLSYLALTLVRGLVARTDLVLVMTDPPSLPLWARS